MKSIKVIASFGIFGFMLSFITGLISGRHFNHIIIDALIFLLVFAAIGAAIYFLAGRILFTTSESDGLSENVQNASAAQSSPSTGHAVDILVEDEELPQEENASQFFVGTGHQMLNEGDLSESHKTDENASVTPSFQENSASFSTQPAVDVQNNNQAGSVTASSTKSSDEGFVPMPLAETRKNISGTEAKTLSEVKADSGNVESSSDSSDDSEELGVLPDLEDIAGAPSAPDTDIEKSSDEDSSSSLQKSNKGGASDAANPAEGKDAALMAKAISTLLAKND